jgi:hypothetical protein
MTDSPIPCVFTGETFEPLRGHLKRAQAMYGAGEIVTLAETHQSSDVSRGHYFATLHELWLNLPEAMAEQYASVEHLRKWCLVKAGYHDQQSFVCSSKAEAIRLAAFLKPIDDFSIVSVNECAVIRLVAKSQSKRAMGAKDFQVSKESVLQIASELVGVTVEQATGAQHGISHETHPEAALVDREPEAETTGSGPESQTGGDAHETSAGAPSASSKANPVAKEGKGADALGWAVLVHQKVDEWRGAADALKTQWVSDWMEDRRYADLKESHQAIAVELRNAVKAKVEELRSNA